MTSEPYQCIECSKHHQTEEDHLVCCEPEEKGIDWLMVLLVLFSLGFLAALIWEWVKS